MIEEKIMKWKLKDAYKEYNKAYQEMNKRKKECNDFLKIECTNIKFRKDYVMFESLKKTRKYLGECRKKEN